MNSGKLNKTSSNCELVKESTSTFFSFFKISSFGILLSFLISFKKEKRGSCCKAPNPNELRFLRPEDLVDGDLFSSP